MPRIILPILAFFYALTVHAQDTLLWHGSGEYLPGVAMTTVMKKMAAEKKLVFSVNPFSNVTGKLIIKYNKSKAVIPYEGGDQHFTIIGKYYPDRKLLLLVVTHFRTKPDTLESYLTFKKRDSLYYDLSFAQKDNKIVITGVANKILNRNTTAEWIGPFTGGGLGMNVGDNISMHILPLRIRFENTSITPSPEKTVTPTAPPSPVVTTRETMIQRTIVLDTGFIKLDLYDNGEIDGDTATLLLDGKTILNKQALGPQATTLFLNLSKTNPEHTIELFADNMGSIPPNTALLILTCRNKRYEIHLSSSEKINGALKLVFKPN